MYMEAHCRRWLIRMPRAPNVSTMASATAAYSSFDPFTSGWKNATRVQLRLKSSDAADLDTTVAGGRVRANVG